MPREPGVIGLDGAERAQRAVAWIVQAAALLVVGSHGRSIADRVRASVSATLDHRAPCPVVVVPPGWRPSAAA